MKRLRQLRYTLIVPALVLVTIIMIVAMVVAINSRQNESRNHMLNESREVVNALAAAQEYAVSFGGQVSTSGYGEDAISELFSSRSKSDVSVVSRSDALEGGSFESDAIRQLSAGDANGEYYEYREVDGQRFLMYAAPVLWEGGCVSCHDNAVAGDMAGVCVVSSPTRSYDAAMFGYALYDISFSLFLAVACIVSLWVPLRRHVTDPLEKFANATSGITNEALDTRLDKKVLGATGELADLVDSFNEMVSNLEQSYDSVEAKVRLRTEELSAAMRELNAHKQEVEALNEQLREESAYKSDFLATISHELKTPLSSMLANVGFLHSSEGGTDAEDAFEDIQRNGDDLLNLINQILDAARLDTGHMEYEYTVVDVIDIVNAAHSTFSPLALCKNITFNAAVSDDFPLIYADEDKLEKIVRNLVGNAMKFTPQNGCVDLTVGYDRDRAAATIVVEDNGIGLKGVDLDRLFDRFYQGDRSDTRAYGGTGLGLSLVKQFAELGGGAARAIALDHGARFEVTLPAHSVEGE